MQSLSNGEVGRECFGGAWAVGEGGDGEVGREGGGEGGGEGDHGVEGGGDHVVPFGYPVRVWGVMGVRCDGCEVLRCRGMVWFYL